MIKKITLILLTAFCISFIPEPDKEYGAKLTLNDWNTLILSVNSPDDVTANQKKAILSKLIPQIQSQIIADTIPKKK